jgi:hypothetical protein
MRAICERAGSTRAKCTLASIFPQGKENIFLKGQFYAKVLVDKMFDFMLFCAGNILSVARPYGRRSGDQFNLPASSSWNKVWRVPL